MDLKILVKNYLSQKYYKNCMKLMNKIKDAKT